MTTTFNVTLIDHMGSDLSVVNAARVSFAKTSEWEAISPSGPIEGCLNYEDERLIKYLAKHNHWSPFGHASMQFHVKAPVFVARQLVKHQVGLIWNEVSRRYVDYPPELFKPEVWRGRPVNSKQGSAGEINLDPTLQHVYETAMEQCLILYNSFIDKGIAPEQARMILPQSMMTEWYWSGSLYAFARVCNLRCKPDVQKETRDICDQISDECSKYFPISWKYLKDDE